MRHRYYIDNTDGLNLIPISYRYIPSEFAPTLGLPRIDTPAAPLHPLPNAPKLLIAFFFGPATQVLEAPVLHDTAVLTDVWHVIVHVHRSHADMQMLIIEYRPATVSSFL